MSEHRVHHGRNQRKGTAPGTHVPVLVREVMASLQPRRGEVVVDCTLGFGGHASEFLRRIAGVADGQVGVAGLLIGLDMDGAELARTRRRLAAGRGAGAKPVPPIHTHHRNFAELPAVLAAEKLDGVDVIFADLGVSSMQVDDPSRGISYKHADSPLDMRMDARLSRTGADLLATLSREELSAALRDLSDEPDHARIAEFIVNMRQAELITQTGQLIRLVFGAKNTTEAAWKKRAGFDDAHPAARTFQALRILVNDELASLRALLATAERCLRSGGRIGIISFQPGEDRMVRDAFAKGLREGVFSFASPRPVTPPPQERGHNPRSASALFRWAMKAAGPK